MIQQFKQLKQFLQTNTNQFNSIFPNSVICVSSGHVQMTPDGKFGTFADFAVRKAHYGAHFSVLYRTDRGLEPPKFFYATRNTTIGTIRINKNAIELWHHYGYPMNILAFGYNCYYIMDSEELKQRAEEAIKTEECNDKYYNLYTKDEWKPLKTEITKEDYLFGERINFRYLQNYVFAKHSNGHNVTCKFPDGREMQAKSRTSLYKWLKDNANAICSERAFVNHILANKPIKCQYKGQLIELMITDNTTTTRSRLFDNESSAPKLNVVAMEDKFNNGLILTTLDNLAGTKKQFFIINKLIAANKNDKGKLSISNDNFTMENFLFEADEESLDVQMKHAEEIRNKLYMVTSSGNKSIHCIIHTNYVGHDKDCYKYIWKRLAEEYFPGMTMDSACSNNARKSRTPNAIRDNGNVQKLLWANDVTIDVSDYVDDFKAIAAADACRRAYDAENRSNYHTANYSNLPAVKNYFAATKGSRNNCAYKAAYAMLNNGFSENETLEMLNMGPIEKSEIKQVITSAKRGNK